MGGNTLDSVHALHLRRRGAHLYSRTAEKRSFRRLGGIRRGPGLLTAPALFSSASCAGGYRLLVPSSSLLPYSKSIPLSLPHLTALTTSTEPPTHSTFYPSPWNIVPYPAI